ncbi:GNAT family N-acetyltransferase [Agrobacterium vaccinii]|uniref:GNAT family N-acetyltransferase n=1 Tax=Agrobacterium vaccinii TaxID=2735528 RepID=UPI001E62AFDB|nr:GNAT family N-acetyltransferase [Agrobacterium vaccinii]UHS56061.1 GNAT family N-acetyltransferase [Agrobacterium vaccinii]
MNQNVPITFPVRPCCDHEIALLADIERDAFLTLRDAGGIDGEPVASDALLLERSLADGLLFVATNENDQPVGFIAATEVDGELYIEELDVLRAVQGRGIGARLMHVMIDRAAKRALHCITLTTDRLVPFNAPFYEKLGFSILESGDLSAHLRDRLSVQIAHGLDPQRRVAMALAF